MPTFVVKYIDNDGSTLSASYEADSVSSLKEIIDISENRILSIKESKFGFFIKTLFNPPPKPLIQASFLASLSANVMSGQAASLAIKKLAVQSKLKFTDKTELSTMTTSESLKAMRFSPEIVVMAKVGEKSGNIGESLQSSAEHLIEAEELKEEMGKGIISALMYAGASIVALIVVPLIFGGVLNEFLTKTDVKIQTNLMTDLLLGLHSLYTDYVVILVSLIVLLIVFRKKIWKKIQYYPVFRLVRDLLLLKRSIIFLKSYTYLLKAGVTSFECINIMLRQAHGYNVIVYNRMLSTMKSGKSLSVAIDTPDWPESVRNTLHGFELSGDDVRFLTLNNLVKVLLIEQKVLSRKIAFVSSNIGRLMILFVLMLIALGALLPLQSLRSI